MGVLAKKIELYTHTHPFNGPFSRTTRVSWYQKGKTNLDFTEARDSEWQWHQLGHMQVCTSLQTDNHASNPPLKFFTGRMPFLPPNQQRHSTEGIELYGVRKIGVLETTTTATVLWPLYRSVCVSRHLQLRTGGFCWCKVLMSACFCCVMK